MNKLPTYGFLSETFSEEKIMTDGNIAYLALVIGSFAALAIVLGYYMVRVPSRD